MSKKQPVLQYVIMCDDVAVYQDSNKVAILGVFEQIFVEKLPAAHSKFWLLTRFTDGQGSFSTQNKIVDPAGKAIFESEEVSFQLNEESTSYNINGQLLGLPLEIEGAYRVETYLDGKLINSTPLQVLVSPPVPSAPNETTYH